MRHRNYETEDAREKRFFSRNRIVNIVLTDELPLRTSGSRTPIQRNPRIAEPAATHSIGSPP
jgi:hypothetical protein